MVLNLRVMAPNRIVWNSEAWEIVSSTNSGQIGILPNHAPLLTALDMGVLKIRHDGQWSAMAPMGGFAMIENNQVTILVNEASRSLPAATSPLFFCFLLLRRIINVKSLT